MSVLTMCRRAVVIGTAGLALGPVAAGMAEPVSHEAASTQPAALGGVVEARVRVPPGILAGVPSGGDPYIGSRPLFFPVPPVVVVAPPVLVPPWLDEFAPIDFGPCFVPTEHTSQRGYYGSCPESYFRQYFNRPD